MRSFKMFIRLREIGKNADTAININHMEYIHVVDGEYHIKMSGKYILKALKTDKNTKKITDMLLTQSCHVIH